MPIPQQETQYPRVLAGVVYILVALGLGAAPKVKSLFAEQAEIIEGLRGYVLKGFVKKKGRLGGRSLMARMRRLCDQGLPLHTRPQRDRAFVAGVVADVEVDAGVGGNEDEVRLNGPVAIGNGQDD